MNNETPPDFINDEGTKMWYKGDKLHREDGPAKVYLNGYMYWYFEDELHNLNGPAIICPDGHIEWYVHGRRIIPSRYNRVKNPDKCKYPQLVKAMILHRVHNS